MGEKQQASVDHDINTRLNTFLLSFMAIVTTNESNDQRNNFIEEITIFLICKNIICY